MYEIQLEWKEYNLNLQAVETWLKDNAGEHYAGNSADACLHLWFSEEPSQEIKDDVAAHWDGLDEESEEATSYKTKEELASEAASARAAAMASATTKLEVLGLSSEEIAAILGQ